MEIIIKLDSVMEKTNVKQRIRMQRNGMKNENLIGSKGNVDQNHLKQIN